MAEYQQLRDHTGGISSTVLRRMDNAYIPDDPRNRDRQLYLQWLEEGNVPDPPDPLPEVQPGADALAEAQRANARLDAGVAGAQDAAQQTQAIQQGSPRSTSGEPVSQEQFAILAAQVAVLEAALRALVGGFSEENR